MQLVVFKDSRRSLGETILSVRVLINKEVINQRPDGIVVDANLRRIYVIEIARTEDSTDQLRHVFVWKNTKYIQFNPSFFSLTSEQNC